MFESLNAAPGPLDHCQITGSTDCIRIIDLGHQPPCDAYLTDAQLDQPEQTYPLRLNLFPESGLAQLDYVIPAREVYPLDYPYRAGISWPVVAAHEAMAKDLVDKFGVGFVVDIGANDGTLIRQFHNLGCPTLGVEPTNVGQLARDAGLNVLQEFFTGQMGAAIAEQRGQADIITMTHVFAHMGDLGEVMAGVKALLAEDGVLVVENQYLLDVLERNQFDTIYHEHVRTYSLKALQMLFRRCGLEVFYAERVGRYGGNIRVYVSRPGKRAVYSSVPELVGLEESMGLFSVQTWTAWRQRVEGNRSRMMAALYKALDVGATIVGCSAPGRATTLLNYYGIGPDVLPYTGELKDSLKIGKYVPGCHIPVVDNREILLERPDVIVLLAWHYAVEIAARLRREGLKSRLITPLPFFGEVPA